MFVDIPRPDDVNWKHNKACYMKFIEGSRPSTLICVFVLVTSDLDPYSHSWASLTENLAGEER